MNLRKVSSTLIAAALIAIAPLASAFGDLVGRLAYTGTITIVIDQKAERILGKLLRRKVKAGDRYYGGKIVFQGPLHSKPFCRSSSRRESDRPKTPRTPIHFVT